MFAISGKLSALRHRSRVMRTILTIVLASLAGSAQAQGWETTAVPSGENVAMPYFDIETACKTSAHGELTCLRLEQFSYNSLKEQWAKLDAFNRQKCLERVRTARKEMPTTAMFYVTLELCVVRTLLELDVRREKKEALAKGKFQR